MLQRVLFLLIGCLTLASCGCPSKATAERRVGRYVECYPELKTIEVDTITILVPEIEYRDSIAEVIDSSYTDSIVRALISDLSLQGDSEEKVTSTVNALNDNLKKSIDKALAPIDTMGVMVSYEWKGNALKRNIYVKPREEKKPVVIEKIQVKAQSWFDFKETYWVLGIVLLLMFLLFVKSK